MRIRQDTYSAPAYRILAGRVCALFFLVLFGSPSYGQTAPYFGALGGISVLSADAGSRTTGGGLNLSSYSPTNGGALDLFAGVHTQNYFTFVGPTAASGHTSGLAPESFIFPAELSDWSRREVLPYVLQMNFPPPVRLFARTLESICGLPAGLIFATVSA